MTCLAAICLTQAWMMWKFINFQLKKWREHSQNQASKKKAASPKSKPHKRELTRGECALFIVGILYCSVMVADEYASVKSNLPGLFHLLRLVRWSCQWSCQI